MAFNTPVFRRLKSGHENNNNNKIKNNEENIAIDEGQKMGNSVMFVLRLK